jgi:hypothetical protein
MFAVHVADFDQNGVIDGIDFLLWQRSVAVDSTIDADGDGICGTSDFYLWQAHVQDHLLELPDFNADGSVDLGDYAIWRSHAGNSTGATFSQGDADHDGDVDGIDFLTWQRLVSFHGAWFMLGSGAASGLELVDATTAPRVTNVTISGSTSTHDPYSFATHVGSGEQLRTVPVGGADTISITFSDEVNVEASYLRVIGTRTFFVPILVEFTYNSATTTATWRFANLPENDQYAISLSDAITNTHGYRLDGEWTNPAYISTTNSIVSHFPSGNGHAGGSFNFVFTLLAGDANEDNQVAYSPDYSIWSAHYFQHVGFTLGDFNGDGTVDSTDIALFYGNLSRDLRGIWLMGDINCDGVVNADDLDIVLGNLGNDDPVWEIGDVNQDRVIDARDVDLVMTQYGMQITMVA